MATYSTNQLKRGLEVMLDNDPCGEYASRARG